VKHEEERRLAALLPLPKNFYWYTKRDLNGDNGERCS
jgi:hypothetical protein